MLRLCPTVFQLLAAIVFIASQFPLRIYATRLVNEITENDLGRSCLFHFGALTYNLCPLILESQRGGRGMRVDGGQTPNSRREYEVALDGMRATSGDPSWACCPEGTWVCMTETPQSRFSDDVDDSDNDSLSKKSQLAPHLTPIAGKRLTLSERLKQDVTALISAEINDYEGEKRLSSLNLLFTGAPTVLGRRKYASIDFVCDKDEPREKGLHFVRERRGVHSFTWVTRHACPSMRVSLMEETTPDGSGEEEKTDETGELLDPNAPGLGMSRRWMAIIMLGTGLGVISAYILVTSPHARHLAQEHLNTLSYTLSPVLRTLEPLRVKTSSSLSKYRQGDLRLVRWAEEDMALVEDGDVMVNGTSGNGWEPDGLDEYIPLKRNTGQQVTSYGTATSGERQVVLGDKWRAKLERFLGRR